MTLTDELYESVKDIWSGYHEHPFVDVYKRQVYAVCTGTFIRYMCLLRKTCKSYGILGKSVLKNRRICLEKSYEKVVDFVQEQILDGVYSTGDKLCLLYTSRCV